MVNDPREESLALELNTAACEGMSRAELDDLFNKHWIAQKALDKFLVAEITPTDLLDTIEWAGVDMDCYLIGAEENLEYFELT